MSTEPTCIVARAVIWWVPTAPNDNGTLEIPRQLEQADFRVPMLLRVLAVIFPTLLP